ncbi:WxL domain-containing protein [Enterococcus sp. AZ163]|uniref:WxL domain-containing protein n=1 Tax=Enterococcus sp. AZ163 TaxID=2774638 RepID=UPI003D26F3E1
MTKRKLFTGVMSAVMLVGVVVSSTIYADAATYSGQSNGSVSFKAGDLVLPPTTGPTTPPASDFGLLYIPGEFNFEETSVPSSTVTANTFINIDTNWEGSPAANTGGTGGSNPATKHVGIGDVRGTNAGWKLEAKLTNDLIDTGASKTLTGATIEMSQTLKEITNPATGTLGTVVSTGLAPTVAATVSIGSGSTTSIMNAPATKGQGYWNGEFTNIRLKIPAAAMNTVAAGEQYEGTVDWTLTDAP